MHGTPQAADAGSAGVLGTAARLARGLALGAALLAAGAAAGVWASDWRLRRHAEELRRVAALAARLADLEERLDAAEREVRASLMPRLARLEAEVHALGARTAADGAGSPPAGTAAAVGAGPPAALWIAALATAAARVELAAGNRGRAANELEGARRALADGAGLPASVRSELLALVTAAGDDLRLGRATAAPRLELLWHRLLAALAAPEAPAAPIPGR